MQMNSTMIQTLRRTAMTPALAVLASLLLAAVPAAAAPAADEFPSAAKEFRITFPVNSSRLDRNYRLNAQAFARLDSLLSVHGVVYVDSVLVVSKSSPEGRYKGNVALSERRSLAIYDYIAETHPELVSRVRYSAEKESWAEFRQMLLEDPTISSSTRDRALAIVDADLESDAKKARLYRMPEYKYFLDNYFPAIRFSAIVVVFDRLAMSQAELGEPQVGEVAWTVPEDELSVDVERRPLVIPALTRKRMIAALKTNLLYDAVTALNFEVEVPIGDRYSVMVEDVFPWWETGNKYCLQMWEIGIEPRVWLRAWDPAGANKLRGWFAGVYAMSSKYDFQIDRNLNYQGEYWSTGLSAGYVMPIGRRKRVNLEFSLAAGFLQTDYRHYLPTASYDKLIRDRFRVGKASYFGPTKAKISLVVPINIRYTSGKEVHYE